MKNYTICYCRIAVSKKGRYGKILEGKHKIGCLDAADDRAIKKNNEGTEKAVLGSPRSAL